MAYVKPVPRNVYVYGDRFGPWPNERPLPPERGARPLNPRTRPWPMFKQGPRGPIQAPRYIPRIDRMPGRLPLTPALRYAPRFVPIPWVAPLLPLVPYVIREIWPVKRPGLLPMPGSNVKVAFVRDCGGQMTWPNGQWMGYHAGLISNCLSGQVFPGGVAVPATQSAPIVITQSQNPTSWVLCDPVSTSRVRNVKWWHATGTGDLQIIPWAGAPNPFPRPEPNEVRFQPAPRPEPNPYEPAPLRPPQPWEVPWFWTDVNPGRPLPPVHRRQPPPGGTKENKSMSRAKKFGILAWNILDNIAEFTEIGGALYDALPDHLKTCGDFGLNIGQYGSDMNACMTKVLYKNFDQMNPEQAFFNIAKMVAEDMTVGAFHKFLSKLYPPGFSWQRTALTHFTSKLQAEAYIVKQLKKVFAFYGL